MPYPFDVRDFNKLSCSLALPRNYALSPAVQAQRQPLSPDLIPCVRKVFKPAVVTFVGCGIIQRGLCEVCERIAPYFIHYAFTHPAVWALETCLADSDFLEESFRNYPTVRNSPR